MGKKKTGGKICTWEGCRGELSWIGREVEGALCLTAPKPDQLPLCVLSTRLLSTARATACSLLFHLLDHSPRQAGGCVLSLLSLLFSLNEGGIFRPS